MGLPERAIRRTSLQPVEQSFYRNNASFARHKR